MRGLVLLSVHVHGNDTRTISLHQPTSKQTNKRVKVTYYLSNFINYSLSLLRVPVYDFNHQQSFIISDHTSDRMYSFGLLTYMYLKTPQNLITN